MALKAEMCLLCGREDERKPATFRIGAPLSHATYSVVVRFSLYVLLQAIFFGSTGATLLLEAPHIEPAQESIVVERGGNLTLTCRGKYPVHWVIDNRSTTLVHLNYTDVSFFSCVYRVGNLSGDVNHPLASRIYVFVKDESELLVSEMKNSPTFATSSGSSIIIPCKPTFPEVEVAIRHGLTDEDIKIADPIQGYFLEKTNMREHYLQMNYCVAKYKDREEKKMFFITVDRSVPKPIMKVTPFWQNTNIMRYDVIEGADVNITCEVQDSEVVLPEWILPSHRNKTGKILAYRSRTSNEDGSFDIISALPLMDMNYDDEGTYECVVRHLGLASESSSISIAVVSKESPFIELTLKGPEIINRTLEDIDDATWSIMCHAYPQPTFVFFKNGDILVQSQGEDKDNDPYSIDVEMKTGYIYVEIKSVTLENIGAYEFQAYHQPKNPKKLPLTLLLQSAPRNIQIELVLGGESDLVRPNKTYGVKCRVEAYPEPVIILMFAECLQMNECQNFSKLKQEMPRKVGLKELKGVYEEEWRLKATSQGLFLCLAHNIHGNASSGKQVLMIVDGPSLEAVSINVETTDNRVDVVEGDNVTLKCYINKMVNKTNMQWYYKNSPAQDIKGFQVSNSSTIYSEVLELRLTNVTQAMSGLFMCRDQMQERPWKEYSLDVEALEAPTWSTSDGSSPLQDMTVSETESLTLACIARGQPMPTVIWYKDGKPFEESLQSTITRNRSAISFSSIKSDDEGTYVCKVSNRRGKISAKAEVKVEAYVPDDSNIHMLIVVGVLATIIFATCFYFTTRLVQNRRERLKIKLADQRAFEEGDPMNLNPELGLEEQAELLPYSPKWELSKEQIVFERMLGSGAFGKVYRASVANLVPGQSKTTVAVKMMKCRGDKEQLKALRSELKIMIHIGRHINIVNLLGACSKNMAIKGELLLVVEYCKYGCLLNYMHHHRKEFVNQIHPVTDKIDQTIISHTDVRSRQRSGSLLSRRAACRQSRIKYAALQFNADGVTYTADASSTVSDASSKLRSSQVTSPTLKSNTSGVSYPESTDTRVESPIPNRDLVLCNGDSEPLGFMKNGISSTSYRQRSGSGSSVGLMSDMTCMTMESSGASDGYVHGVPGMSTPLCSMNLLCWAFQIARGMEYLSFRKVLHGDLAARNILLDENHIVKISDFGMAKDIYKNDNYLKHSEGHLPVKWLSIEAIRDRIFSTQSDVWSYGVVLWEIFSLGQNPYPGLEFDMEFLRNLERGMRMEQPPYATHELYQIMLDCWHDDPRERPCFSQLEETLGGMIGETEKQFYLDFNQGQENSAPEVDYLSLMRSPDYNSIVHETTPVDGGYVLVQNSREESQVKDIGTLDSNVVGSPKSIRQLKPSLSLSGSFSNRNDCFQIGTPTLSNEVFDIPPDTKHQDANGEKGAEEIGYRKKSPKESYDTDNTYLQMNSPKNMKDTPYFVYPERASLVPQLAPVQHTRSTDSKDSGFCSPLITQTNPCYLRMTSCQSTTQDKDPASRTDSSSTANSCMQRTETGVSPNQKPSLKPKPTSSINDANYVNCRTRTESSCSSDLGSLNEEHMEESVTFKAKEGGKDIHPIAEEVMQIEIA